jgi:lantibiotic transport system permease protein
MIGRLLSADFLKLRRTMVLVLVFLGPFGVIALEAVNFGLRYDYMNKIYEGRLWEGLLQNVSGMAATALLLGATLVASMIAGYEHRTNAWKQLLALPVSRFSVFVSKFLCCTIVLFISSALLAGGTYLLGGLLGYGWEEAPVMDIVKGSFYPLMAGLGVVALQLWLSVAMRNQAIPVTVGILGTMIGMFSFRLPSWLLWKWALIQDGAASTNSSMAAGILTGLVLVLCGAVHFTGRDVN